MNRRLSTAVSFALLMLVPVLLSAQACPMKGEGHKAHACLDLTAEQKVAMEKLKLEHRLAGVDIRAEQAKLRLQMKEEMMKDEPSRKALEKLAKGIAANSEKLQMMRIGHMLDMRKLLTPEQWKIFASHHSEKMGDRGCRHGMMGKREHRCCDRMRGMHERGCRVLPHRDGVCCGEGLPHRGKCIRMERGDYIGEPEEEESEE